MPKTVHYVYTLTYAKPVCGDAMAETVTVRESDVTCFDCLVVLLRPTNAQTPRVAHERVPTPEEPRG